MIEKLKYMYLKYDFLFSKPEKMIDYLVESNVDFISEEEIEKALNTLFLKMLQNKQKYRRVLNKFCNKYLYEVNTAEEAIKLLSSFDTELIFYHVNVNKKLCEALINSSLLIKNNTKLIYDKYKDNLSSLESDNLLIYGLLDSWKELHMSSFNDYNKAPDNLDTAQMDIVNILLKNASPLMLTPEEIDKYGKYLLSDDENLRKEAKKIFVEHNIRLVTDIAEKYQGNGLSFEDVVMAGFSGLLEACDKYDVTQGFNFATFATYSIKKEILNDIIKKSKSIRLPHHIYYAIQRLKKIIAYLENTKGKILSEQELADEIGVELKTIKSLVFYDEDLISLNVGINPGEEDSTELGDFIEDKSSKSVEEQGLQSSIRQEIFDLFKSSKLNIKQIEVLKYRYGFYGKIYSLPEVGEILGCTRQNVQQIEKNAIFRIRLNEKTKSFAVMIDNPKKGLSVLEKAKRRKEENLKAGSIFEEEVNDENLNEELKIDKRNEKQLVISMYELELIDLYMEQHGLMKINDSGLYVINQIRETLPTIDINDLLSIFDADEYLVFSYCLYNENDKLIRPSQVGPVIGCNSNKAFQIYRNLLKKIEKYFDEHDLVIKKTIKHDKVRKLI